ncbi:zinc finger, CCHC-type containing protein [Tanacetum coccineum]|uniref:Zinc finger, CCHC-type containing protein n=1 Tax=Tanacetum coccineum TaxID=301880 RepID=A0ABQ5AR53_9ASTR
MMIRSIPLILRKWTMTPELSQDELTFILVWVKLYGVLVLALTSDRLSVIATQIGTPMMLDSCSVTAYTQSWGHMDYALALIDLRGDRARKNSLVISVPSLLKEYTKGKVLEKVLVGEEVSKPITKYVNAISLVRIENDKDKECDEVIDKKVAEPIEVAEKQEVEEDVENNVSDGSMNED